MADRVPCEFRTAYIPEDAREEIARIRDHTFAGNEPGTPDAYVHVTDESVLHQFEAACKPMIDACNRHGVEWVITTDARYEFPGEWITYTSAADIVRTGLFMQSIGPVVRHSNATDVGDNEFARPPEGIPGFSHPFVKPLQQHLDEATAMMHERQHNYEVRAKLGLLVQMLTNTLED